MNKQWAKLQRYFMRAGFVFAMAASAASAAQTPERYPWDNRPLKCFAPGAFTVGSCTPIDNWPDQSQSIQRIVLLYNSGNFALLERALAELEASDKRFVWGSPQEAVWYAFGRIMYPGVQPVELERVAQWRKAVPNSIFVPFAEARYAYTFAWNARGMGYASSVSDESWELFAIRLQQAEQMLLKAPTLLKDTTLWHHLLLGISLDSNRVQSKPAEVFDHAVKRFPRYFPFYETMAERLLPKWGGSWEKVDAFVYGSSRLLEATEGKSMYARLYISLLRCCATPDQTRMNWTLMKESFDDLIVRYPDPIYKNLYASYACALKDKPAFSNAMARIPPGEMRPESWLDGNSYDSCLRWGGT
jgi:hypothetical protein